MAKKSLLEQAKDATHPRQKRPDSDIGPDDIELVEAWLASEITLEQMKSAKKFQNGASCYVYIARVCRVMYQQAKEKK